MSANRDTAIEFVRGISLPWMMVEHLRKHWLATFVAQPVGFFSAAAVFLLLSGFSVGKRYGGARATWKRALQIYGLHVSAAAVAIPLAARTPLGREIEIAITNPGTALLDAMLLRPGIPMLDFLPLYFMFLIVTPLLMHWFEAGQEKPVLAASFALWLFGHFENGWTGWQMIYVTGLFLGYVQRTEPLRRPEGVKGLNLGLFGTIVAMAVLRQSGVIEQSPTGPLAVVNLFIWVAFLWLVPAPLMRLVRQGRLFIELGSNAFAVCAWMVMVSYSFLIWFPHIYTFTGSEQLLIVSCAVATLVAPMVIAVRCLAPVSLQDEVAADSRASGR